MNAIYINKNGQQQGPYAIEEIQRRVSSGDLSHNDYVWYEGCADWVLLGSVPDFMPSRQQAPSPIPFSPRGQQAEKKDPPKETTIWEGHPSAWEYTLWWVFGIVMIPLAFTGIPILILVFLSWKRTTYLVTNRKVMVSRGIFLKNSSQIRIKDIRSLNLTRRGIGGLLFGLRSVEMSSAASDKTMIVFQNIVQGQQILDLIDQVQDQVDK